MREVFRCDSMALHSVPPVSERPSFARGHNCGDQGEL